MKMPTNGDLKHFKDLSFMESILLIISIAIVIAIIGFEVFIRKHKKTIDNQSEI